MWIDRRKLYFQNYFFHGKMPFTTSVKYEFVISAIIILSVMRAINTSQFKLIILVK